MTDEKLLEIFVRSLTHLDETLMWAATENADSPSYSVSHSTVMNLSYHYSLHLYHRELR